MNSRLDIRRVCDSDIDRIAEIYNWYILNATVTFEIEAISPEEMRQRVRDRLEKYDWLVAEAEGQIVGYAYYGAFHSRAAYQYTVETTIYLAWDNIRRGIGKTLYGQLLDSARARGFREAVGVVALPNPSSEALHHKLGFQEIGTLKNVGYKFGKYLDVGIWQKSLAPPPAP